MPIRYEEIEAPTLCEFIEEHNLELVFTKDPKADSYSLSIPGFRKYDGRDCFLMQTSFKECIHKFLMFITGETILNDEGIIIKVPHICKIGNGPLFDQIYEIIQEHDTEDTGSPTEMMAKALMKLFNN